MTFETGKNDGCSGIGLLKLDKVLRCRVRRKVNRFVVEAETEDGVLVSAHNTNTGRLEDILFPGSMVYCVPRRRPGKTSYSLVGSTVYGGSLVNTRLQEQAFAVAVDSGLVSWLKGCRVGGRAPKVSVGRLDFVLECDGERVLVELKSAVLRGPRGEAMYPDCPTERGRRHIEELVSLVKAGQRVLLVFIAGFPGASMFRPYRDGDPVLAEKLREAVEEGLDVKSIGLCLDVVGDTGIVRLYDDSLPVKVE